MLAYKKILHKNDSADENCATGLFGWLNGATVKNLTIDGAVVKGHHNVGIIAGYLVVTANGTSTGANIRNEVIGRIL